MNTQNELNYRMYIQREFDFFRTDFNSEFEKYAAICSGDLDQVKKNFDIIRKDYLAGKGKLSDDPLRNIRYHVIIATALTARMCVENGLPHDIAYTLSDIYIQYADKTATTEKLVELLGKMQFDFTSHMRELHKNKATSLHVRKCIDYIFNHLDEKLTVSELSEIAGLNRSYLSKLFAKEAGTSIKNFVQKAKISTAENMIKYSDLSELDISIALGFSSQSAFVQTFKKITGTTPGKYKNISFNAEFNNIKF